MGRSPSFTVIWKSLLFKKCIKLSLVPPQTLSKTHTWWLPSPGVFSDGRLSIMSDLFNSHGWGLFRLSLFVSFVRCIFLEVVRFIKCFQHTDINWFVILRLILPLREFLGSVNTVETLSHSESQTFSLVCQTYQSFISFINPFKDQRFGITEPFLGYIYILISLISALLFKSSPFFLIYSADCLAYYGFFFDWWVVCLIPTSLGALSFCRDF